MEQDELEQAITKTLWRAARDVEFARAVAQSLGSVDPAIPYPKVFQGQDHGAWAAIVSADSHTHSQHLAGLERMDMIIDHLYQHSGEGTLQVLDRTFNVSPDSATALLQMPQSDRLILDGPPAADCLAKLIEYDELSRRQQQWVASVPAQYSQLVDQIHAIGTEAANPILYPSANPHQLSEESLTGHINKVLWLAARDGEFASQVNMLNTDPSGYPILLTGRDYGVWAAIRHHDLEVPDALNQDPAARVSSIAHHIFALNPSQQADHTIIPPPTPSGSETRLWIPHLKATLFPGESHQAAIAAAPPAALCLARLLEQDYLDRVSHHRAQMHSRIQALQSKLTQDNRYHQHASALPTKPAHQSQLRRTISAQEATR